MTLPMITLDTRRAGDDYLERLRAVPAYLETVAERHRAGVAAGRVPVARLVRKAVAHLDRYLADPSDDPLARQDVPARPSPPSARRCSRRRCGPAFAALPAGAGRRDRPARPAATTRSACAGCPTATRSTPRSPAVAHHHRPHARRAAPDRSGHDRAAGRGVRGDRLAGVRHAATAPRSSQRMTHRPGACAGATPTSCSSRRRRRGRPGRGRGAGWFGRLALAAVQGRAGARRPTRRARRRRTTCGRRWTAAAGHLLRQHPPGRGTRPVRVRGDGVPRGRAGPPLPDHASRRS